MRDHRKVVFYDISEDDPYRGEAIFTGAGIGEHYANLSWEDRSLLLRGPAALGTPDWHHFVTTFKRDGDAVIYWDGNPAGSVAIGPVGTTFAEEGAVLNIGQDGYGDYSPALNAEFDEVAVWGRVLSLQEIAAVYQAGAKGQSFLAVSTTPTLSFTTDASGNLVITYTGVLQSATSLGGTFGPVAGATSPYTVKPSEGPVASFFRSSN